MAGDISRISRPSTKMDVASQEFWQGLGQQLYAAGPGPVEQMDQWVRSMAVCADQVRAAQKVISGSAGDELEKFRSKINDLTK